MARNDTRRRRDVSEETLVAESPHEFCDEPRPMRVCHLIHSLRPGGAEHILITLAEIAADAGIEMSLVSLMPDEDLVYARQLRELGIPVRSLSLRTRWDGRGLRRAVELVRGLEPDLIHTHLKHADLVGAYVSRRLRVPMVSTLHVIEDAPDLLGRFKRQFAAQARTRTAMRTIAVSDAQRRWYLDTFAADPRRVTTLRNGIQPPPITTDEDRKQIRDLYDVPPTATVAAMVSLMRPGKGHQDLFAALRLLPQDLAFRVILAGDGPLRMRLEAEVRSDDRLSEMVLFAGFVDDVPRLLAACDLVVHPSHSDALPTALIYALASGLPSIASNVGGISEVVSEDAGILIPVCDPSALAAAILTLVLDPGQRDQLGATAHRRFRQEFDARNWANRLHALYSAAMTGHGAVSSTV